MRQSWHERFAETPDVLKSALRQKTVIPVLDLEIGGNEFITMAGPCSVETEFQLMATANHVGRAGARILAVAPSSRGVLPMHFRDTALRASRCWLVRAKRVVWRS